MRLRMKFCKSCPQMREYPSKIKAGVKRFCVLHYDARGIRSSQRRVSLDCPYILEITMLHEAGKRGTA